MTAFDNLLDTFEADLDSALAASIQPGCNMPCIPFSRSNPDLWWYAVQGTETGLVSALADEDNRRSDDRFQHLVFFPTFSSGEIVFHRVQPGEHVRVQARSDDTLIVIGDDYERTFPNQIVVLAHSSLDFEALQSFYSQES